jgi:hypothetical protein
LSLVFVLPCFAFWPFVVIGPMFVTALLINVPRLIALRDTRARSERLLVIMGGPQSPAWPTRPATQTRSGTCLALSGQAPRQIRTAHGHSFA